MRKLALTLTVALVVGGCTSETEIAQEASLIGGKPQTTPAGSSDAVPVVWLRPILKPVPDTLLAAPGRQSRL